MQPTRQEFDALRAQVAELKAMLENRKTQQIQIPLDEASIGVLNGALYNQTLSRLTVTDLRYKTLTAL